MTSSIKVENYKALPDTLDEFKNFFISPTNNNLTNENLFKYKNKKDRRRISVTERLDTK